MKACIKCSMFEVSNSTCHRFPRTADGFPKVIPDRDWCGEFVETSMAPVAELAQPQQQRRHRR